MPAVRAAAAATPPIVPMNFRRLGNDTVWGSRSTVEGRVSKITEGSVTACLLLTHLFIVPDPTTDRQSHFGKILPPKAKMVKIIYSSKTRQIMYSSSHTKIEISPANQHEAH